VARALVEYIAHRLHATRAQTPGALPAC
jgi:hypothetical protein